MKIIVGVKQVIDYEVEIQVNEQGDGVVNTGVPLSMNPFDEVALEEAIRLKESGVASHILAVTIGKESSRDVLKTALAMGADEALLIEASDDIEPLTVAKVLAKIATDENADVVLLGKQAIDNDANQTGQMTAAIMGCEQGIFASRLEVEKDDNGDNMVRITRDTDYGTEELRLELPVVITAALRLNQPRFISLPQIMKAKKKTITVRQLDELGLQNTHKRLQTISVREPKPRKPVTMLDNTQAVADIINAVNAKIKQS